MVQPMVHSKKHYVQFSLATVAMGVTTAKTIVVSVAQGDVNLNNEVNEGCTVKAVYLELWLTGDDALNSTAITCVEKRPGGHAAAAYGEMIALTDYDNKKNIFETHMGLVPSNTSNPVNVYRGWIKIPKSKQRFGLGDILAVNIAGQSDGLTYCGFAMYKEYT